MLIFKDPLEPTEIDIKEAGCLMEQKSYEYKVGIEFKNM